MKSHKWFFGVSFKISVMFALLLLVGSLALSTFSYAIFKNGSIATLKDTAMAVARSVTVNGDELSRVMQTGEKDEYWVSVKNRLDELTVNTPSKDVYILGLPYNGEYPFFALGHGDINIGDGKSAEALAPELADVYAEAKPDVSNIHKSDGEYKVSAFIPVFDSAGNVAGVVGTDIEVSGVFSDSRSFALKVFALCVLLTVILSSVSFILTDYFFGSKLRIVSDDAQRLARGDTDLSAPDLNNTEIGAIFKSLSIIRSAVNVLGSNFVGFTPITGRDVPRLLGGGTPSGVIGGISPDSRPVSTNEAADVKLEGIFAHLKNAIDKIMAIVENVDSLIYISDINTFDLLFANRKLIEKAGLQASEIHTKKCWQVLQSGMTGPCPFCPLPKLLAEQGASQNTKKSYVYEREHYDRSAKKWYLMQSSLIKAPDGKTLHFEIASDITKLKAYENGMKNLSAITAVKDAGIIVKDRRGIITEWNPGAQNILGYSRDEMIGKTFKSYKFDEDNTETEEILAKILKGEHISHAEMVRKHKNGNPVNCSVSYTPIFNDNETVSGFVTIFHDISEKKKIEEAHKVLESTLFNLFDNLSNGFALFEIIRDNDGDENLLLVMANKAFGVFSGKPEGKDLIGLPLSEAFSAVSDELSYYMSVAKNGGGRAGESYNYMLKMHIGEVVFSPSPGQVALLLTDRTHIVKAQEALKKSEKDLAMLFSSMTAGFCLCKIIFDGNENPVDAVFEIVNSAYETLCNYTPGSLLGRNMKDECPKEWQRHFKVYADVAVNRTKTTFTKYIPLKNKTLDVICYSPTENYFVCIVNDVTDRVEKDLELKKSYRDTEAILSEIPAPICAVNRINGKILGCNRAFVSLCGADTEEELKDEHIEAFLKNPDENTDTRRLLESGNFKCFLTKRDFSPIAEVDVFSRPFIYKDQIAYAVCLIDMTQQKLQEEILKEAALNAEETSRLKSMFLANMSHEIRTPMNGIIGLTELALDGDGLSEKTADYLNKIKISATGLLAIINDILDVSKIEAGKIELEKVTFLFGGIFKSCKAEAAVNIQSEKVKLEFNCDELAPERVIGDPTKLRQIFMNLLSNALKFTNEGSVELSAAVVEKDEKSITARFTVKDTGIGMSAAQIKKIFEPFSQADVSTTRKYGGTGLGLSITGSLLELMGGKLSVESAPGAGSTFGFTLTFPLADEKSQSVHELSQISDMKKPIFEGDVLVCEDNAINCQVVEEHLLKIGLKPVIAENGKIGVNMAKTRMRLGKPFDIILMDIHMPVMDGLEAMQKLIEAENKTPVIAMTANAMREDRDLIISSGMSDYISKPFTARDLWNCLLKYLTPVRMEDISDNVEKRAGGGIIDEACGIEKAAGNRELYEKIKTDFYFENIDTIKNIREAISAEDFKAAHRYAHTLKGVSNLIGATSLSEAARALERILYEGKYSGQDERTLLVVEERLGEVMELLAPKDADEREVKAETCTDDGFVPDILKITVLAQKLEPILESGNSKAANFADEIRETFPPCAGADLIASIDDYEFETALRILQKIIRQTQNNNTIYTP